MHGGCGALFPGVHQAESCGKCTACREGTRHLSEILTRITHGQGRADDLDLLAEVGERCGRLALRPGPDRAQPGALHAALFPGRVRGRTSSEHRCPAGKCAMMA